ncbi:MAG: PepSY-like domain-containing protein [Rufibacter sp.]
MRTLMISLMAAGSLSIGCSQKINVSDLPSVVQNGLKSQFPAAANLEWEKAGEFYEAEFDLNQVELTAQVDATGKVVAVKQDVAVTDLPSSVSEALKRDFPAHQIDDLEKVERSGQVLYQVELENANQDVQRVYTQEGTQSQASYWD